MRPTPKEMWEGRYGVYLATLGHTVTSVDLAKSGMAKASRLAARRDVELTTVVADLAEFDLGEKSSGLFSKGPYTPVMVLSYKSSQRQPCSGTAHYLRFL
jgi:hypothetical protein